MDACPKRKGLRQLHCARLLCNAMQKLARALRQRALCQRWATSDSAQSAESSRARNRAQFEQQAEPFAAVPAHADGIEQLLDAGGVQAGRSVLDVACGPGLVSLAAAARGARVTGVDVTLACVATAQASARAAGYSAATASFLVAPAERLPFADASFDLALCRYALHHLTPAQQVAAVSEMARVVVGGGRILLADVAIADAAHAEAYDELERIRDSSHAGVVRGGGSGMAALLLGAGLTRWADRCYTYPFTASAESIVAASFPDKEAGRAEWLSILRTEGPPGRLGIQVSLTGQGIRYAVPIAVEVATKAPASV